MTITAHHHGAVQLESDSPAQTAALNHAQISFLLVATRSGDSTLNISREVLKNWRIGYPLSWITELREKRGHSSSRNQLFGHE